MPVEILLPALSPTMTEGGIAKWCKNEGDEVKIGDVIVEIETDKATMEVEAMENGTLGKILSPEGTKGVKINSIIGILLENGEDQSILENFKVSSVNDGNGPNAHQKSKAEHEVISDVQELSVSESKDKTRIFASPLARKIAQQNNIDLSAIDGRGPRGRIVKADIMKIIDRCASSEVSRINRAPSRLHISRLRKAIADKLTEVKRSIPHFYLCKEVNVDKLLEIRADVNRDYEVKKREKISVNDLIIKAVSLAFRDMPEVNLSWQQDYIEQYHNVDAAVAVAVEGGIFTPIVKNADQKSVFAIAKEVKLLAARAKSGELKTEQFSGGSFTISNLGMYGIDNFAAILNSPQSCIFAIGGARQVPVLKGREVVPGNVMSVTISCDHRAVDGAVCAQLMNLVKDYLENPIKLFI